jgi:hypothetical protein
MNIAEVAKELRDMQCGSSDLCQSADGCPCFEKIRDALRKAHAEGVEFLARQQEEERERKRQFDKAKIEPDYAWLERKRQLAEWEARYRWKEKQGKSWRDESKGDWFDPSDALRQAFERAKTKGVI